MVSKEVQTTPKAPDKNPNASDFIKRNIQAASEKKNANLINTPRTGTKSVIHQRGSNAKKLELSGKKLMNNAYSITPRESAP